MAGGRSVTIYGTVMGTRLQGNRTIHRIEATRPGGGHLQFEVAARKRRKGAVRVRWDPLGVAEPRFLLAIPWASIGLLVGIAAIVVLGWFIVG